MQTQDTWLEVSHPTRKTPKGINRGGIPRNQAEAHTRCTTIIHTGQFIVGCIFHTKQCVVGHKCKNFAAPRTSRCRCRCVISSNTERTAGGGPALGLASDSDPSQCVWSAARAPGLPPLLHPNLCAAAIAMTSIAASCSATVMASCSEDRPSYSPISSRMLR